MLFGALALRFFQPQDVERKHFWYKRTPKSWRPDGLVDLSVLQQCGVFNFFVKTFCRKVWREILHARVLCGVYATHTSINRGFDPAQALLIDSTKHEQTLA